MSRELEIRTTILAKKSGRTKAERKDANDNDVYADEALQLLQEIQELKNNVRQCVFNYDISSSRCSTFLINQTCFVAFIFKYIIGP